MVTQFLLRGQNEDGTHAFYEKDEKAKTVVMTDTGSETVEDMLR